ncbi:Tripartite motif-containing protein 3 [Holothuria leucospilota]|uniref:Tripartite motif-containing protein 3 n=1 Tax=Holothuria leucospilota TaxID=206669 RepID=A0A9Q0YG99_HOLLE|nr:Tripartite motif-containing protein 3 [Holothuria leucospilota]
MAEGGHSLNVSCSICFEDYKTPKVLTCGHTFCCQCVSKMVGRNSYLQCPTCRKDISLPESGKVEDFTTNFALLSLILDQKKIKKGDGHLLKADPGFECPQHKNPTTFYCKSCKKSVCAECLLQDHKPDKHTIATTSDMAVIFSGELQKHLQQLKVYENEAKSLGKKISEGLHCYEEDKKTVQDQVNIALERKKEMLEKSAEKLINELHKKAKGHTGAYTDLQAKHSTLCDLSSKIHKYVMTYTII